MPKKVKKRGFACLSAKSLRRVSALGGAAAHRKGKAHKWTSEEAKAARAKQESAKESKGGDE